MSFGLNRADQILSCLLFNGLEASFVFIRCRLIPWDVACCPSIMGKKLPATTAKLTSLAALCVTGPLWEVLCHACSD